jgi:FkbM family methyltransferase
MNFSERLRMLVRLWKYRLREERDSLAFMRRQPLAGRTVLDVGANKGIYSYWMCRQVGRAGRVIAFEPQPELLPHLDDLKRTFGLANLEIVAKALSNGRGAVAMHRDKPGALGATLDTSHLQSTGTALAETIGVEMIPLDDYCREAGVGSVAFIKCDVEGHELAVFQGARRTLEEQRPTLLFECHHHEAERGELFRYLVDLGYEGHFLSNDERFSVERFAEIPYRKPSIRFRNYVFAHPSANVRW